MYRLFPLVFLTLCLLLGLPQKAEAAWWEFFFPSLKKEQYDPYENLQAPFATEEAKKEEKEKIEDLDAPHRTVPELSAWIFNAVSEATNFTSANYQEDLNSHKVLFDDAGWNAYLAFLEDKKMMNVLKSGQYEIHGVVQDTPILINRGIVDDRYRWLYETNIMVTYLRRGARDYKTEKPVNQYYRLNVQAGRHHLDDTENEHGLLLENITGKEIKK